MYLSSLLTRCAYAGVLLIEMFFVVLQNITNFQSGTFGGVTFGSRPNNGNPTDFLDIFLSAEASGWVAIGFSPTASMVGA